MKKNNIYELLIFFLLIILLTSQIVSSDGGVFVDYGEHVYIPDQKAIVLWNGKTETMIISSKINISEMSNIAWVTPIQSNEIPEVNKGTVEAFTEVAESFAEYTGTSFRNDVCILGIILFIMAILLIIIAFIKRNAKIFALLLVFTAFLLIFVTAITVYIYSSGMMGTSDEVYSDVDLIEIKTIDFYDIAILKATNATQLVNWLSDNEFIIPEASVPILQEYCDQSNFYFIVNKINMNNSKELSNVLSVQIEENLSKIKAINEKLTNSNINYFYYADSTYQGFEWVFQEPEDFLTSTTMIIFEDKPYDTYSTNWEKNMELIGITPHEYELLQSKYSVNESYEEYYIFYLKSSINTDLTLKWYEDGIENEFTINNNYTTDEKTWWIDDHWWFVEYGPSVIDKNVRDFLNSSAPKVHDCYQELLTKMEKSKNYSDAYQLYEIKTNITQQLKDFAGVTINIKLTEGNLLDGSFLTQAIQQSIDKRDDRIKQELKEGIATPLEITFQPETPMYPMKMTSINNGTTKINVYFVSNYHVNDISDLLTTKKKSSLSWEPILSNYNVGDYITWMTFEGDTTDLIEDSYFVKIE